jgi:signal transduction histidine kinase
MSSDPSPTASPAGRATNPSLERHLLGWLLGALALGGVVLVIATYFIVLDEMNEVFDESLKQVAIAAATSATFEDPSSLAQAREALPGLPRRYDMDGDFDFVTAIYDHKGHRLFTSDASVQLPFTRVTGLSHDIDGPQLWHVYTIVLGDRVVQAAQRGESRRLLAVESATKLLVPISMLVALIGVLVVVALRRGLRPLDRAAGDIALRSAASLAAIDASRMPGEIRPMLDAINGLMQRLGDALAAQRRFVADAAHELRSPITAVRLQLQLLERAADAQERAAATAELRLGVERAQRLVEQLLDLSRVEPDAPSRPHAAVDLGDLVEQVVTRRNAEAMAKRLDLSARSDPGIRVVADERQLDIMIDNIVGNAIRYTPSGGHIEVETLHEGERAMLRVVDDGAGIAPAERERVFDRFYRGESLSGDMRASGSGLGLAIVKAIAVRHGCEVALLTPRSGRGLEVRVMFDATAAAPEVAEATA